MSLFRKFPLVVLLLSLGLVAACNDTDDKQLETLCNVEGAFECLEDAQGLAVHRLCVDGKWTSTTCAESQICRESGCAAQTTVCKTTAKTCLDIKTIEICVASEVAQTEVCGEGFHCDLAACVAGKVCNKTAKTCIDLRTAETCVEDATAEVEICGSGLVCDLGACVVGKVCNETVTQCSDLKTIEICVASEVAQTETCGDGFHCDLGACVVGKVCSKTEKTCLDNSLVELCVVDQLPTTEACGSDLECDTGLCVDACHNNRLDVGEDAVDCGGDCAACVNCRVHADCGVDGFCDSANAYVCSKRCRSDKDCVNSEVGDDDYCRGDGRCSPKVFETVWELTAEDPSVVLPFDADYLGAKCDFQILWGDEPKGTDITVLPHVTDCNNVANRTHRYLEAGRYHVKIIGTYDGWGNFGKINTSNGYNFIPAASKLRGVLSFGPVGLSWGAFYAASELVTMPERDVPDASKLRSLDSAFFKASIFNAAVGHWDTSKVKTMIYMFLAASEFNQPLAQWDTSQVTSMCRMFDSAEKFNQPIGSWNTSNVTDMGSMLRSMPVFNQPIGEWDTSSVTNMDWMFVDAVKFNQPIGEWDTSSVMRMDSMFARALAFNQDLSKWTLKSEVVLGGIFESSGMDNTNLCALKALGGAWLTLPQVSGAICK